MKTPYNEKLANNEWHKVRDAVRIRDNYICQKCGDDKQKQDVHHIQYLKGKEPWDSPMEDLITLCWKCHQHEHVAIPPLAEIIQIRLELIDKINSVNATNQAKNTWGQSVSMMESEAMKNYGVDLKAHLNPITPLCQKTNHQHSNSTLKTS
jgi:hypothetical protein